MHLTRRSLTFTVGGVSRTADVSNCRIVRVLLPEYKRQLTRSPFYYRLQGTAAQDPTVGSFWDLVWDHIDKQVDVILRPAGGDEPSDDRPWFVGVVRIEESEGELLGGEANPSPGARFLFAFDWAFLKKPDRVTSPFDLPVGVVAW